MYVYVCVRLQGLLAGFALLNFFMTYFLYSKNRWGCLRVLGTASMLGRVAVCPCACA